MPKSKTLEDLFQQEQDRINSMDEEEFQEEMKKRIKEKLMEQLQEGRRKPFLEISILDKGHGCEVGGKLPDGIYKMMTKEDIKTIGEAMKIMAEAVGAVVMRNAEIFEWMRNDGVKEHDCENCPEEIRTLCEKMKGELN